MTEEEALKIKLEKGDRLHGALWDCLNAEPALTFEEIAIIMHFEIPDEFGAFIQAYKKELKKRI